MFDVVALGELLVDFTYQGRSENGMRLFEQNPGGAPANVLCALSNLGQRTAFIGKVGNDMHGDFLRSIFEEKAIDTRGLIMADDVFTTLAFVELSENGERKFSFARKPGADTCLSSDELHKNLLTDCRIFHFGSLSLTNEPSRTATIEAVKIAKEAGAIVSFDPNYRAPLWENEQQAAKQMKNVLNLVNIIKISDEETRMLTGFESYEKAADSLLKKGISCVVVTLGEKGAYAAVKDASVLIPVPKINAVDTTGAGDAFWGGFLSKLAKSNLSYEEIGEVELKDFVAYANAVAALCVQKRGGIPAMPGIDEVTEFLKNKNSTIF